MMNFPMRLNDETWSSGLYFKTDQAGDDRTASGKSGTRAFGDPGNGRRGRTVLFKSAPLSDDECRMAEEKEWMDMESRIRRYIGNNSFRILLTSKANGERFSKCSGILLEGVEGGVLYLLPEPEAERIMKEKDERFCLGVGKEHHSVMEIPEAYQEALLAREMAFIQKNPVEEYQKKCFEEKPELAQFQEKFILQVPTDRADTVLRKMRNWYFEAAHQRVSPISF